MTHFFLGSRSENSSTGTFKISEEFPERGQIIKRTAETDKHFLNAILKGTRALWASNLGV